LHRREVRLLDNLREDFSEEACKGERDCQEAGRGPKPENLDEDQGPEQLVDRAQDRSERPHGGKGRIRNREHKPADCPHPDAKDREGDRPDHAPGLDGEEVGVQQPAPEPGHLGPGVKGRYRDVRHGQAGERGQQEGKARITIGGAHHPVSLRNRG
jgi:hypothetical protein